MRFQLHACAMMVAGCLRRTSAFHLQGIGQRSWRRLATFSSSTTFADDGDTRPLSSPPSSGDTVYALSTGASGAAGVAVVRISGPQATQACAALLDGSKASLSSPSATSQHDVASLVQPLPKPRRAALRKLYAPRTGELLDEAIVLLFPGPNSFTGEDVVELQTHGSQAVVSGVLSALADLSEASTWAIDEGASADHDEEEQQSQQQRRQNLALRPAERGEFTQRAFGNGRLGLTEVEGLADLLAADTSAQRRQALAQMGGATERVFGQWRTVLAKCLAHAEAVIDFGDDEDDVDSDQVFKDLLPQVASLRSEVARHLRDSQRGEMVRSGLEVAIVGPPNAGKSTLLNLLAQRDAAIVSDIPGTTRDVLEVRLDLGGVPVLARDTAGLRVAQVSPTDGSAAALDPIEAEGIRRAWAAAAKAQLVLFVVDATNGPEAAAALAQLQAAVAESEAAAGDDVSGDGGVRGGGGLSEGRVTLKDALLVLNKCDCEGAASDSVELMKAAPNNEGFNDFFLQGGLGELRVSCRTGDGVEALLERVQAACEQVLHTGSASGEPALLTRARHRKHAMGCLAALDAFLAGCGYQNQSDFHNDSTGSGSSDVGGGGMRPYPLLGVEVCAEELRVANRELGRVVGDIDVEEVLDVLFKDFCIGK